MRGEFASVNITGPFGVTSIHSNKYGLVFIDHCIKSPFTYAMQSKAEFSKKSATILDGFQGDVQKLQRV